MTSRPLQQSDPSARAVLGKTLAQSRPHWPSPVRARAGSPNVIVILMDDMGFSDLGCFGGDIDTPHIDALAAGGLRFTGYTTVPMCTPARAALLTGRNPHSVGCGWLSQSNPGFPGYGGEISLAAPTMAELLRAGGIQPWLRANGTTPMTATICREAIPAPGPSSVGSTSSTDSWARKRAISSPTT